MKATIQACFAGVAVAALLYAGLVGGVSHLIA
jgi:hypothetical protein